MADETKKLTNLDPRILEFQDSIRAKYSQDNQTAKKGQIVFVGSSLMEIFPIEKFQEEKDLGLDKHIYNRGVRATTTNDLLMHLDVQIFDLEPSKIFINIGTNDIGFGVLEETFLGNYDKILSQIKEKLPECKVYVMEYYPVNNKDFGKGKDEEKFLEKRSSQSHHAASEKVAVLAKKYGYEFINVNAGLTDEDGELKKEYTFDGAHLLPVGFEIVLANMMEYLKE